MAAADRPGPRHDLVTTLADEHEQAIAVAHLMRTDCDGVRELGLLIEDSWQRQRLGTQLTGHAIAPAAAIGCHTVAVMTGALAVARNRGAVLPPPTSSTAGAPPRPSGATTPATSPPAAPASSATASAATARP
ncbi:hypothetical protein [Streptomyces sp. NPDC001165]|uniref:hypothetical protein n=1 Tax=Streptomyces sp. NPDC001165 TaxID=3364546 RepID=UPI0036A6752D